MDSIRIRSGSGLGDNLYMQSIVNYLVKQGKKMIVSTAFPDMFSHLPVEVCAFSKLNANMVSHYTTRKHIKETSQFEDCCINCNVPTDIPLKLDWRYRHSEITKQILKQAGSKKIVVVAQPRVPFGRHDNFGIELMPEEKPFLKCVEMLMDAGYFIVRTGNLRPFWEVPCHFDAAFKIKLPGKFDIAHITSGYFGQVSSIIPIGESFGKPVLSMLSRKGLNSKNQFISLITPEKVNHYKKTSLTVLDDEPLENKVTEFCKLIG